MGAADTLDLDLGCHLKINLGCHLKIDLGCHLKIDLGRHLKINLRPVPEKEVGYFRDLLSLLYFSCYSSYVFVR